MKKMAIFTEGQTEQIFIERLLREIAGINGLTIETKAARGGRRSNPRTLISINISNAAITTTHYAMIVDCGTDNRVRSDIGERYDSLVNSGFSAIIGIRDVFPDATLAQVPALRRGLKYGLKSSPVQAQFILGIMEVESWFIAEHTHFPKTHARITTAEIVSRLGFNPETDDIKLRLNPASDLHDAYQIAGLSYKKKRNQVQRTTNNLDYAKIYLETRNRFEDLDNLVSTIDAFLS